MTRQRFIRSRGQNFYCKRGRGFDGVIQSVATSPVPPTIVRALMRPEMFPLLEMMSAGLEMLSTDRFDARLSYEGRFGENVTQHGGSVKLRAKL